MLVNDLETDATYFLVADSDGFASIDVADGYVIYSFEIYGRMIQALLDDYDEVKVQIAKKMKFEYAYFKGSSPEDVENATVGFVQNVTKELKELEGKETIVEDFFPVTQFIPDEKVSLIGSKIITSENYTNYLDVIDVIKSSAINSGEQLTLSDSGLANLGAISDTKSIPKLNIDLFENQGYFPGLVTEVSFPRQCELEREAGESKASEASVDKLIDEVATFRDLYANFFSINEKLEMVTSTISGKPEFQKMKIKLRIHNSSPEFEKLPFLRNLVLRVSLIRNGIEMNQENFTFDNKDLFMRLTADYRDPSVQLIVHDPVLALPDTIAVTNPNKFSLEVAVFRFLPDEDEILYKKQISNLSLPAQATQYISSDLIVFDSSETRAYVLTANRALAGISGVGNACALMTPPEIKRPTVEALAPRLSITDGVGSIGVVLSGLPDVGYKAVVYRRELGFVDKKVLGSSIGNGSWEDDKVYDGSITVYTAKIFVNDAISELIAEAPAVWYAPKEISSRIGFSITDQRLTKVGRTVHHQFKIAETTETTPASLMLSTVNEEGEAGLYSDELEAEKTDTSLITQYMVFQYHRRRGTMKYTGTYQSKKAIKFSMNARKARQVEYYVIPLVTAAASLSYKSVVEEKDELTGNAYKFSYKKWRDSMSVPSRKEILPSNGEIFKDDLYLSMLNSQSGLVQKVEFGDSSLVGVVKNVDVDFDSIKNFNFIKWKYTGNTESVAYFVVMANYNGVKAPVGMAIPNDSRRNQIISFCDRKLAGAFGVIEYSIIPVLTSGEMAAESLAKKVENLSTYPEEALLRT